MSGGHQVGVPIMTAMEDTYILKFRLSDLGRSALKKEERQELCEEIYAKLTSIIDENQVHGLQLYPQKWPKTVILSFKNESIKNKIYMEGLDIFNRHIELQDCSETAVTKVIVYDAPVGMTNDKLREIFSGYGEVINVEEEMHTFNGRVTSWSTGNRLVNMTVIRKPIPSHMTGRYRGQLISINTWYQGQGETIGRASAPQIKRCFQCGTTDHVTDDCPEKEKLCFVCKNPGHLSANCPNRIRRDDKTSTKENADTLCFLGEDAVFSSLNKTYRTIIDGKSFVCIEQYIQYEKAILFDDQDSAERIMTCENPYELRALGRNITGFQYWKWKQHMSSVMKHGIYEKFSQNKDAKKALFETGNKVLAEASRDTYWGCGTHITDESVLIKDKWEGKNHMGRLLMEIREELVYDSESDEAEISMSASDNDSVHSVTNETDLNGSRGIQDASASTLDVEATEPRGKADNSDDSVYCDDNDDDHDTDDDVEDDDDDDDDDHDGDHDHDHDDHVGHDDHDNDEDNDDDDGHGGYGDHDHYGDDSDYGDQGGQGPQDHDHGTDDHDHDDNGAYDEGNDNNCSPSGDGYGDEKNGEGDGSGDNDKDDFNGKNSRKETDSDAESCDEMSQMLNEKGKCVLVIGDSNCRDVMTDVPFNVERQVMGGTAIFDVESLLGECTVPKANVFAVVLHVGTCDFDHTRTNNVESIYVDYIECIHNIVAQYPGADILISSILPRASKGRRSYEKLNAEITELNKKLCMIENEVTNITFVDNDRIISDGAFIKQSLYNNNDRTGIHLNDRGAKALTDNLLNGLHETYYKMKLLNEYDVTAATSLS